MARTSKISKRKRATITKPRKPARQRAMSAMIKAPARKQRSDAVARRDHMQRETSRVDVHEDSHDPQQRSTGQSLGQIARGAANALSEPPTQSDHQQQSLSLQRVDQYRHAVETVSNSFQAMLLLSIRNFQTWQNLWLGLSRTGG